MVVLIGILYIVLLFNLDIFYERGRKLVKMVFISLGYRSILLVVCVECCDIFVSIFRML